LPAYFWQDMKKRSSCLTYLSIALIFSVLSAFISCRKNTTQESKSVFCYNESNGITTLDPAFSRDMEVMWATNQLFDGLVELDSAMNVVPCIAHSWDVSPDGMHYRFFLRSDVYFHPSPLFADSANRRAIATDFVYSFNRILDPALASPASWIFSSVDRTHHGGFEAVNDSTLDIHLKEPFQPFLGMLTMQYCNVVPREVAEHYGADFREHPIGTGPFRFAFWYENIALIMHRNNRYWMRDSDGNRLPYLDAVKIEFVKDMSVEFQGLLQGKYDFMSGIHSSFKDELLDQNGNLAKTYQGTLTFQRTPFIKTDYLGFQVDSAAEINAGSPLMNRKVRQAISYAIDKQEMVRYLRNNTVFPANSGFVPPMLNPSNDNTYYKYDVDKARTLLTEAGYPEGKGMPEIVISTTGDYADLIEYIQHALATIGLNVRIQVLQGPALREQSAKAQLAVFRKSWLADYADAENFLAVFYSRNFCPSGPNYTHYNNSQYDALYESIRYESNDSLRFERVAETNELLMQDAPVIPLYYDQVSHFIRNNVQGLETNPVNMLDLRPVRKQ
jgi:oligopeptide transport system substrate-binding protein